MSIKQSFDSAVKIANQMKQQPSNEEKLILYKYYKQATIGDVNIPQPGFLDFTGKAKWDAWNSVKGINSENAMQMYIKTVNLLISKNN